MTARIELRTGAFLGALTLGGLADLLIDGPGRPGLGMALWAMAGVSLLWLLARTRETPVSRESGWLLAGSLTIAALLTLRDVETLYLFTVFSSVILLGFAIGRGATRWSSRANFVQVAAAAVRTGVLIALGPLGWSLGPARRQPDEPAPTGKGSSAIVRTVARGVVMGLPPLIFLGALLSSADPVFERLLRSVLLDGLEPLVAEHLVLIGVVAWGSSGILRAALFDDAPLMDPVRLPRPALSPMEISIAIALLDLLFVAFLAVQARYLFGGAGLVEVTEGLTYAEYARRGFFELVTATALVVPLLMAAEWAAGMEEGGRRAFRATSTLLVVLLAGVLASAAYRMHLYQDAYGLTEDRLYVSVFILWLAGVLAWLALTVIRGRREGVAFAAALGGIACIVALHLLNPHAIIARVNLERAASGELYDGRYLESLGADAVPVMLTYLETLPAEERCRISEMLARRWTGERSGGWISWNLGDWRARRLVEGRPRFPACSGTESPP